MIDVAAQRFRFGTGLATMGGDWEEYRDLFGEALILDGNFFWYPAVRHPTVDYMLAEPPAPGRLYRFLHGFGFNGSFSHVLSFHGEEPVELDRLAGVFLEIAAAPLVGVALLAEIQGLWGMHLRQTPIVDHAPPHEKTIFAPEHFSDWVNYSLEPTDKGHILAAAGVAARSPGEPRREIRELFPTGKICHLHGAVFSREPLAQKAEAFPAELRRVLTELPAQKVTHLQGLTRLYGGLAALIPLLEPVSL